MSIPILENGLKHGGSEVQLFEPDFRSFEENANAPVLDKALSERFRSECLRITVCLSDVR